MKWFKKRVPQVVGQPWKIEIELSTKCPIKCPLCPQSYTIDHYPGWNSGYLDPEILFKLVREHPSLKLLILCGAYGDPIYHPKLIEIMERLGREHPDLEVFLETNGSFRSEEWWTKLGRVTTGRHVFSFSIDGMEDSNPKYRLHADWKSIMSGVRALRAVHPGTIQWKWIVFSHNQHQVQEGWKLSREMGFDVFKLVESQRHTNESWPTANMADLQASLARAQSGAAHEATMS